jgi:hypothetical protein
MVALSGPAAATTRLFSYDPADSRTRQVAGGLTFQFDQSLFGIKITNVRATEGKATADLAPASPASLGPGGIARVAGAPKGDLYAVLPTDDGAALTSALCPGSRRAWMAIGKLKFNEDVQVYVIGDDPAGGPARTCQTLAFTFHGEWRQPPSGKTFDTRELERPQFPN